MLKKFLRHWISNLVVEALKNKEVDLVPFIKPYLAELEPEKAYLITMDIDVPDDDIRVIADAITSCFSDTRMPQIVFTKAKQTSVITLKKQHIYP